MPASWWSRAGATILDFVIVWTPLVVVTAIGGTTDDDTLGAVVIVAYLLTLAAALLYAPVLMARAGDRHGQTLGKQALRIRVVREDGAPMTAGRGCLRELVGKVVLGVVTGGVWTIVDNLWPLGDRRRQALHDKIASTLVVRDG